MAALTTERQLGGEPDFEYLPHCPIVIADERGPDGSSPRNDFSQYRFSNADIIALPRILGRQSAVLAELLPVIECLNHHPAGSFSNLSELYAGLGARSASGPSTRAIGVMRNLFLYSVNRRLQDVYRRYFQAHPPPAHARHDQKIASLEATLTDAQDIVSSYDWHWLADWLEIKRIGETAESCVQRLSNFAFPIQCVNFRFTYHCNIACRHCYNSSGPHLKVQRIPLESMLAIVAQMPGVGIDHLNLTGGEPFLYPDHLTALIAAGRAAGLRGISIYTNGYWAPTDDRATRVLERLAAAGFMQGPGDFIKVSTGAYHQEFVAFNYVLTLARNYHAMFGRRLMVDFELAPGKDEIETRVRQQVSAAGLADRINLYFREVSPMGRGKRLEGIATGPVDHPCNLINQIVFDPDGSVRPCCGLNNENQGVVIGRMNTRRLIDLVKRMQNDPILQFLASNPMSAAFEHVAASKNADGYADACHLCQDAIGSLADKTQLQAELFNGQQFYPFWFTLSGRAGAATFLAHESYQAID